MGGRPKRSYFALFFYSRLPGRWFSGQFGNVFQSSKLVSGYSKAPLEPAQLDIRPGMELPLRPGGNCRLAPLEHFVGQLIFNSEKDPKGFWVTMEDGRMYLANDEVESINGTKI